MLHIQSPTKDPGPQIFFLHVSWEHWTAFTSPAAPTEMLNPFERCIYESFRWMVKRIQIFSNTRFIPLYSKQGAKSLLSLGFSHADAKFGMPCPHPILTKTELSYSDDRVEIGCRGVYIIVLLHTPCRVQSSQCTVAEMFMPSTGVHKTCTLLPYCWSKGKHLDHIQHPTSQLELGILGNIMQY